MENIKENEKVVRSREIIVGSNDEIILSVPSEKGRTCININLDNEGLLVLSGGSDIVSRLVGEGWKEKLNCVSNLTTASTRVDIDTIIQEWLNSPDPDTYRFDNRPSKPQKILTTLDKKVTPIDIEDYSEERERRDI